MPAMPTLLDVTDKLMPKTLPTSGDAEAHSEDRRKVVMLYIISIIGIINLIPLGVIAHLQGNSPLGYFDHLVALALIANLVYIVKTGRYQIPAALGIAIVGALFIYLFVTGGVKNTGHMWYYTFPLFSFFLLGSRGGCLATSILLAAALVFLEFNPVNSIMFTNYSTEFTIRFLPSFLVVCAYAFTFEKLREKSQERLSRKNRSLEHAVAALEEKENALQKAQSELEERVKDRTKALVAANEELNAQIANRKRAENSLRLSNERFMTVLDSLTACVYAADMQTHEILFMNKHMQEQFGFDSVGHLCWRLLQDKTGPCSFCTNPKLIDAHGRSTGVFRWEGYNRKTQKWYLHHDRAISWVDGRMVKLQIAIDVSDRKEAEEALQKAYDELEARVADRTEELATKNALLEREIQERMRIEERLRISQERHRQTIENSPNPIYAVDTKGRICSWNASCEKIFEFGSEIINNPFAVLFADDENRSKAEDMVSRAFGRQILNDVEIVYTCKGGGRREMVSRVYPVFDHDGNVERCVFANTDITERLKAEKEMREAREASETANRAKSEFLANMSHELRTPLNHIIGFTEMVFDGHFGDLNRDQRKYLDNVIQSGRHLLSLVNDILDLSKVEAGKLELKPAPLNFKHLLQNGLVMVKEKAFKHRIQLLLDVDGIPDQIVADERKLKQILYNLLSNAVKFTPDGGTVRVTSRRRDSQKMIETAVIDTGIGLKKEDLERIFEAFEQVDASYSRKFQGTGLGLSLTKRLVEIHGGRIWAESDGTGKGATFRFVIPMESNSRQILPPKRILT
jgi:PAS domain S-box-containing protein